MNLLRILTKTSILLLLIGFLGLEGRANTHDSISFERISYAKGLSQNSVFSIYQDSQGFMWFGTLGGLNKYNGYEMEIYQHSRNDPGSINSNRIYDIGEDNSDKLWIATISGINWYDAKSKTFTRHKGFSDITVDKLLLDSFGHFWVGSSQGLFLYQDSTGQFIHHPQRKLSRDEKPLRIYTLYEDQNHILWIGTDAGIKLFDLEKLQYKDALPDIEMLNDKIVRTITEDKFGNVWIGTEDNGAFYVNKKRSALHHLASSNSSILPSDKVRAIFPMESGKVWIGTRKGICIYNVQTKSHYLLKYNKYDPFSLSHNSVRDIYQDQAGSIWVGTYAGGVNVMHPNTNNFSCYGESMGDLPGLNHPVVSAIVEDASGRIWTGTEGGGVNMIDRKGGNFTYFTADADKSSLLYDNVKALLLDKKENLWVATLLGLTYYDRSQDTYRHYKYQKNEESSLSANDIYCLAETQDGDVWAGTDKGGLNRVSPSTGRITIYRAGSSDKHLTSNNIRALLSDGGNLWVGTSAGLNYLDTKTHLVTKYLLSDNKAPHINNNITALFKDANGLLWIGTDGGGINLLDLHDKQFYQIGEKQGLSGRIIFGILEDDDKNVWVSTNQGLSMISLQQQEKGVDLSTTKIINYGREDGIINEQFSPGAFCKGRDGIIYFGGINGITYFDPDKIFKNNTPPTIAFTNFEIMNETVRPGKGSPLDAHINEVDEITLSYDQAFFSVSFAALNFISSDNNRYAYKLEGLTLGDSWQKPGTNRKATYNNLKPGSYTLHVKASNNDGVWTDQGRKLAIHVLPPFWKTIWAYVLYVLAVSLLLYLFYTYSLKVAKLKQKLSYETLIHKNEHDLHQKKLQFFTNVSHEIKTPLTLILAPIEKLLKLDEGNNRVHNQLMIMQRNGERLLRLTNQLLDFRKFEMGHVQLQAAEGDVVLFIREVCLSFEQYAVHKNICYEFKPDQDSIHIWFDRDKLEKILFNLLSNAFKYTQEYGKITLKVKIAAEPTHQKPSLQVQVIDNGLGISPDNQNKIFERFQHIGSNAPKGTGIGLSYTKALVELHGGSITVDSREASNTQAGYTCFTVLLPTGKDHLKQGQIIEDFRGSHDVLQYFGTSLLKLKDEPIKQSKTKKATLLIIEDNDELRFYMSSHFVQHYKVHQARDGEEGRDKALKYVPDIIISDVMMPKENGISLCKTLKNDVRTSHIPIILLTARTPLIFKVEGYETGADDYITKPFHIDILDARVENLIRSRAKLRERFKTEVSLQPTELAISSPDEEFLKKLLAYVEANIAENELKVDDVCREVGLSRTHLYRKVKALTNMSMSGLIRSIRLKRAAQLMGKGRFNISEIAYQVGFLDVDYFRSCFKKQYGVTPSLYQKNYTDPVD